MSPAEKYKDLLAEYGKLASAMASVRRDLAADFAIEAADCASIFEKYAFDVLERHCSMKE